MQNIIFLAWQARDTTYYSRGDDDKDDSNFIQLYLWSNEDPTIVQYMEEKLTNPVASHQIQNQLLDVIAS